MARRRFTDEQEAQIAQEYLDGTSSTELAKKYKCDQSTIAGAIRRQGHEMRQQGINADEEQKILRLYTEKGMGTAQIARQLHHDPVGVSDVLRKHGIWVQGSRNFTDEEEAEIARLYTEEGMSARAIARKYDLGHHISIVAALERQGVETRSPAERNRLYALDPHVFDVIDNWEAAYWLGFLYADGTVNRRTLAVALKGANAPHLEQLRDFLFSESPIKVWEDGKYEKCRIEFTDEHLASRLQELGIVAHRPDHTPMVNAIPAHLQPAWLLGFFDGDGSAHRRPGISFCGRPALLKWIRSLLAEHAKTNPKKKLLKHTKSRIFYLTYHGRKQALRIADYMYRGALYYLDRKRTVIDSWPPPQRRTRDALGKYT